MRFRVRKPGSKLRARQLWHDWFAWYPVRIPERGIWMYWFETVQRKSVNPERDWNGDMCWHYKYK